MLFHFRSWQLGSHLIFLNFEVSEWRGKFLWYRNYRRSFQQCVKLAAHKSGSFPKPAHRCVPLLYQSLYHSFLYQSLYLSKSLTLFNSYFFVIVFIITFFIITFFVIVFIITSFFFLLPLLLFLSVGIYHYTFSKYLS